MTSRVLWLCLFVAIVPIMAQPSDENDPFADDLTSEYAKRIIHQAKVADIKAMMRPEISPCDDFYTHACGNWHRHNPAQLYGDIQTSTFQRISKGFDRRWLRLIRSNEPKSELEKKIQHFYQSCNLVDRNDVHYKLALENVIQEYGALPALIGAQWNSSNFSWWRTVAQIQQKYGKEIILALEITPDTQNNSKKFVYLKANTNFSDSPVTASDLQQYFGLSASVARQTAQELSDLKKSLASGVHGTGSLNFLDELQEKYSNYLNFTEFLSLILGEENIPDLLCLPDEEFINNVLLTMHSTPSATQANFIMLTLLEEYLIDAKAGDMSTWCTENTKKYFSQVAEHAVYERYRSAAAESEVFNIWEQIRGLFRQQLMGDKFNWISNATRTLAIVKLDRMQLHINSYDTENIEEIFGAVTIDRTNYVKNVQKLLIAKISRSRINEPIKDFSYVPFYNNAENNITIPVAQLQPRYLWGDQYPEALKYATLGYVIAHEMLHGFDDSAKEYDAAASKAPWWDTKSRYEFDKRRKCFQAQYHKYQYGGLPLPNREKQSENIADNGGVKLAYAAYQLWLGKQTEEVRQRETMEGLSLNGRQLFFVGYAQLLCDDVQSLFKTGIAKTDSHAPSKYRVIGSLSNFQEFSWVFNCSQSALMNPEYKCAIY
ncbi:membrane metallo-endopeptidase-like 1 [Drosophila rhopaloa]|uniref:Membrane metallo-endopeptidase-like 1 n=1 Tax=Drosophila rhopaloa TaxID=1041015 RepID=A0A6P4FS44_DRORH|nr:membrane metallo-endopeptidase-like 1 [Drosophila rhopaloa]